MAKVKDESYFQISGWMVNRLKLKGTTLNVYAIIYGFTQDGETEFKGSRQYLCDFTGATKPTIDKSLNELVDKQLIYKTTDITNNIVSNRYKVNLDWIRNFTTDKETLLGGKETLPNNILYNSNKEKEKVKKEKFIPPTFEEVEEYAIQRNRVDLAQKFYDYFNAGKWVDSKGNKVKNWKQKFITWEDHNKITSFNNQKRNGSITQVSDGVFKI